MGFGYDASLRTGRTTATADRTFDGLGLGSSKQAPEVNTMVMHVRNMEEGKQVILGALHANANAILMSITSGFGLCRGKANPGLARSVAHGQDGWLIGRHD